VIIEEGLTGLADGGHFFDLLADDVVFDYIITIPATRDTSKAARPSQSCTATTATRWSWTAATTSVHHDARTGVVVLEYASQGRVVPTGSPYTNRYISVLTISGRKVSRWRDYLDPVAVFDAVGWPPN